MEKNAVNIYKSGMFYNVYGDDAVILYCLLNYKVTYKKTAGFPDSALNKVKNKLEEEKINYNIYDKNDLLNSFVGVSKRYNTVLKEGLKKLEAEERLSNLKEKLDKCSKTKLENIIELIEKELNE